MVENGCPFGRQLFRVGVATNRVLVSMKEGLELSGLAGE